MNTMSLRAARIFFNLSLIVSALGLPREVLAQSKPAKRVLIIGIDGTRPDAMAKARTPNLDELIRQGAFTDQSKVLGARYRKNDTISGPGWSSILTGVWADKHGVQDNSFKGRNYELFPHFFKRLKQVHPEAYTVSMVSWKPIHDFIVSEADVLVTAAMPRAKGQVADLTVSADQLDIETRDGKWHHLVATRKAGTLQIYLDGKLLDQLEDASDRFDLEGDFLYLGRDSREGATQLQGQLDDVRIWNRALSAAEIEAIHDSGSPDSRDGLLAEYLFEMGADDTAGHGKGPFPGQGLFSDVEIPRALVQRTSSKKAVDSHVLDLTQSPEPSQGVCVPLSAPLRQLTQGDYTLEVSFKTTDTGRSILLGNYAGKLNALNLELQNGNKLRLYQQPAVSTPVSSLKKEIARDLEMGENAARILREEDPDAMFVYFHQVDATGHTIGFSPEVPEYVRAIENVDTDIGTVLKGLRSRPQYQSEDWLVIVCTDHGGYLKGHGDGHDNPEINQVFMIVSGPSAVTGRIEQEVALVDVAATALAHLTGKLDKEWMLDGKAVGLKSLR